MITLSPEQRELLAKLGWIAEMVEQHEITVFLLERGRLQLQTKLPRIGYEPPSPRVADG